MSDDSAMIQIVQSYISKGKTPKDLVRDLSQYWNDELHAQIKDSQENFARMIRA